MDKVGIALFGVGRAGMYHLPTLAAKEDVSVRWVVDLQSAQDRVQQLCQKFHLRDTQFVSSDHCQAVFDDPKTTAVVVTTPTQFHEDITKQALTAGKHVFCEKPISFTSEVVKSCYLEARKQDRVLFCGFNKRFDEHHVQLRQQMQGGLLGTARVVHYAWRDPATPIQALAAYIHPSGGIFCDSAIHQLDYIPWLLGEKPCSLVAIGGTTSQNADVFTTCGDVDSTVITLQFPSGVHAVVEVTRDGHAGNGYFRIEVVGTKKTHLSHTGDKDTLTTIRMDGQAGDITAPQTFLSAYKHEMDCFIRVVQGKEKCPVPSDEVIQASALADLCLVSLREGRVVDCSHL